VLFEGLHHGELDELVTPGSFIKFLKAPNANSLSKKKKKKTPPNDKGH
jgi:hypothetical protein